MASLPQTLRAIARDTLLTSNTLRYRIEFARIEEAFQKIGHCREVLDGGAGSGEMLKRVFTSGYCTSGVGLEPDPELLAIMEDNYRPIPALTPCNGSLLSIPFADERFDCVMTTQVLEHIVEHEEAAAELSRVLKRGGYLVVSVPHPPEPFPNPGHVREGYTEADLRRLFDEAEFEFIFSRYFFTRPTLDRMVAAQKLPLGGKFVPLAWVDRETRLTDDERKKQIPFGILALFRKRP